MFNLIHIIVFLVVAVVLTRIPVKLPSPVDKKTNLPGFFDDFFANIFQMFKGWNILAWLL